MSIVYSGIATLVVLAVFLVVRKLTHTNMWSGFLFDLFLMSLGITLLLAAFVFENNPIIYALLVIFALFAAIFLLMGGFIAIAFLIVDTVIMFKKERPSFAHALTLVLAFVITVLLVLSFVISNTDSPTWVIAIWSGLVTVVVFFICHALVFLTTLVLSNIFKPQKNKDYIIVLGSGLVKNQVSPLLADRINQAIAFAEKQFAKQRKKPILVLSGGQGPDEQLSEGEAMGNYAREKGYDPKLLLVEDQSKSTFENIAFSHKIINEHSSKHNITQPHCIFATSNYHVFRAGLNAKKAGLAMDGIGAKTKFYFLPNAVIREYVAYLSMHKIRLLVIMLLLFIPDFFLYLAFQ